MSPLRVLYPRVKWKSLDYSRRFHQTLFESQKVAGEQSLAKSSHSTSPKKLSQICELKFTKSVRCLPNAIRQGVNFINVLRADPKSAKRLMTWLYFLRFRNLHAQNLLVERWWNWPHVGLFWHEQSLKPATQNTMKKKTKAKRPVVKYLEISSCVLFDGNETIINFWFN